VTTCTTRSTWLGSRAREAAGNLGDVGGSLADQFSSHRLLQAILLNQRHDSHDTGAPSTTLDWINEALRRYPGTDISNWPLLRNLTPHAEAVITRFGTSSQSAELGWMHNEIGLFHQSQGDYQPALFLRQSALAISEAALGLRPRTRGWLCSASPPGEMGIATA
jgi:hypothetical protein